MLMTAAAAGHGAAPGAALLLAAATVEQWMVQKMRMQALQCC
jgi:hypothetical protein